MFHLRRRQHDEPPVPEGLAADTRHVIRVERQRYVDARIEQCVREFFVAQGFDSEKDVPV